MYCLSRIEPCPTPQNGSPGKNRRRSSLVQATLRVSKSNEVTTAPRRRAARDDSPDPLPMSRNVFPRRESLPRNSHKLPSASAIRSSFKYFKKWVQFRPNRKRWPVWSCRACSWATLSWIEFLIGSVELFPPTSSPSARSGVPNSIRPSYAQRCPSHSFLLPSPVKLPLQSDHRGSSGN